jgi:hypothetical protein
MIYINRNEYIYIILYNVACGDSFNRLTLWVLLESMMSSFGFSGSSSSREVKACWELDMGYWVCRFFLGSVAWLIQ